MLWEIDSKVTKRAAELKASRAEPEFRVSAVKLEESRRLHQVPE